MRNKFIGVSLICLIIFMVMLTGGAGASPAQQLIDKGGVRYVIEDGNARPLKFLSESVTFYDDIDGYPADMSELDSDKYKKDREMVREVTFAEGITEVTPFACSFFTGLQTVALPTTLRTIGDNAFRGCEALISITLPDGLKSIGDGVFINCVALVQIKLPDALEEIGYGTFHGCGLRSIAIPESVKQIESGVFSYCYQLETISIPASMTAIADGMLSDLPALREIIVAPENPSYTAVNGVLFTKDGSYLIRYPDGLEGSYTLPPQTVGVRSGAFGSSRLTELTLPEGVISLENNMLSMDKLERLNLPSTLESFDMYSLSHRSALKEINVSPGNPTFKSVDGVLFSADGKELMRFPCGITGTYAIPQGVERLSAFAFMYSNIEEVTIPEGVSSMTESTFYYMPRLTRISLPSTMAEIGKYAFTNLEALEECVVAPGNTSYTARDGVLFTADMKALVHLPSARTGAYAIPDGVTELRFDNAMNEAKISELTVPEGFTSFELMELPVGVKLLRLPSSLALLGTSSRYDYVDEYFSIRIEIDPRNTVLSTYGQWVLVRGEPLMYLGKAGESITFPPGITSLPDGILSGQEGLASVAIPEGVKEIGGAFRGCTSLRRVSFPTTLERIGGWAFSNCVNLERVDLPPGLTTIGQGAFYNCASLRHAVIPDSVTDMTYDAFVHAGSRWMGSGWYDKFYESAFDRQTNFFLVSSPSSTARWVAWATSTLWLASDGSSGNAPARETTLSGETDPVGLLIAADARGTADILEQPQDGARVVSSLPNGTPVYMKDGADAPDGWTAVYIGQYNGYVKTTILQPVKDMLGLSNVIYAYPRMAKGDAIHVTLYDTPLLSAKRESALLEKPAWMRVINNMGTWLKLALPDGKTGYMALSDAMVFTLSLDGRIGYSDFYIVSNPDIRDRLNLRDQPSKNGRSLGKYFSGTQAVIVEWRDDEWLHVRLPDGSEGYMMSEFMLLPSLYDLNVDEESPNG